MEKMDKDKSGMTTRGKTKKLREKLLDLGKQQLRAKPSVTMDTLSLRSNVSVSHSPAEPLSHEVLHAVGGSINPLNTTINISTDNFIDNKNRQGSPINTLSSSANEPLNSDAITRQAPARKRYSTVPLEPIITIQNENSEHNKTENRDKYFVGLDKFFEDAVAKSKIKIDETRTRVDLSKSVSINNENEGRIDESLQQLSNSNEHRDEDIAELVQELSKASGIESMDEINLGDRTEIKSVRQKVKGASKKSGNKSKGSTSAGQTLMTEYIHQGESDEENNVTWEDQEINNSTPSRPKTSTVILDNEQDERTSEISSILVALGESPIAPNTNIDTHIEENTRKDEENLNERESEKPI
jgi:hypothetical protein